MQGWIETPRLLEKIARLKEEQRELPVIVVGNKIDLELQRVVPRDSPKAFCSEQSVPHIETSAKFATNVAEAFEILIRRVIAMKDVSREVEPDSSLCRECVVL